MTEDIAMYEHRHVAADSMHVPVTTFDVACPICRRGHLELRFSPDRGGRPAGAGRASIAADRRAWRLTAPGGATADVRDVESALGGVAVWTTGAGVALLADRCLLRAAEALRTELGIATLDQAVTAVSCLVAHVVRTTVAGEICVHGVVIDDRLCTTLVLVASDRVGLVSIAELSALPPPRAAIQSPPDVLPVETPFLEAAPDEPALTLDELDQLTAWQTTTCETPRSRWPWGHLILVSHRWPTIDSPGDAGDLAAIKQLVKDYIQRTLARIAVTPDPRIKATSAQHFGIWIDYMMVPNDLRHGGRTEDCAECTRRKIEAIKRINALLTLATVLPYTPEAVHRGWILQEVSLNAHPDGKTQLGHRDRVRLMHRGVAFTNAVDGARLRCYEFVRLGQMPRTWPAVNRQLVQEWTGYCEETDEGAKRILTEYARGFGRDCHRLKRLMAELPQQIALAPAGAVIDLGELVTAVDEQATAMRSLAATIAADDRPDAPSDPDGLLAGALAVDHRNAATRALQLQQFVGVAMGLRAEWRRGDGIASWVWLTLVTDALAGAKFMARLKRRQFRSSAAASTTTLRARSWSSPAERFAHAVDVATHGVPAEALRDAYQ